MTITLEISPEVQRELAREAEIRGVPVPALAASLLEAAVARPAESLSPDKRSPEQIRAWLDALGEFSDQIPALPGESFSRSTIYQDHVGENFFTAKTLDQLIADQGTLPVYDLSVFAGAIPDEDMDEFVADIYRTRTA